MAKKREKKEVEPQPRSYSHPDLALPFGRRFFLGAGLLAIAGVLTYKELENYLSKSPVSSTSQSTTNYSPIAGSNPEAPKLESLIMLNGNVRHICLEGDNLWNIALSYGAKWQNIQAENKGAKYLQALQPGDIINVPAGVTSPDKNFFLYKARPGETLDSIASRYCLAGEDIARTNRLPANFKLTTGNTLWIPNLENPFFGYHNVSAGDTLYSIAKKYNVPLDAMIAANNVIKKVVDNQEIYIIKENEVLRVPKLNSHLVPSKQKIEHVELMPKIEDKKPEYNTPSIQQTLTEYKKNEQQTTQVNSDGRLEFISDYLITSGIHIGGKRTTKIDSIVDHISTAETVGSSIDWFTKDENWFRRNNISTKKAVSAHYLIDKDGTIYQMVDDDTIAYHATKMNGRSIGIEHVGTLSPEQNNTVTLTAQQIAASVKLHRYLMAKYDIGKENVFPHYKFSQRLCPGKANYETLMKAI